MNRAELVNSEKNGPEKNTNMSALLEAGLMVTLVGMGVVFTLLTLLVGIIQGMSRLSRLIEGAVVAPAGMPHPPVIDDEIASVIGAAIRMYRRRHGYRD